MSTLERQRFESSVALEIWSRNSILEFRVKIFLPTEYLIDCSLVWCHLQNSSGFHTTGGMSFEFQGLLLNPDIFKDGPNRLRGKLLFMKPIE